MHGLFVVCVQPRTSLKHWRSTGKPTHTAPEEFTPGAVSWTYNFNARVTVRWPTDGLPGAGSQADARRQPGGKEGVALPLHLSCDALLPRTSK